MFLFFIFLFFHLYFLKFLLFIILVDPIPVKESFFVEKKLKNTTKITKKKPQKQIKKPKTNKSFKPLELTPNQLTAYGRRQMRAIPSFPKLDIQKEIETNKLNHVMIQSPIKTTHIIHDRIIDGKIVSNSEIFEHPQSCPDIIIDSSKVNPVITSSDNISNPVQTTISNPPTVFKPGQLFKDFACSPKSFQLHSTPDISGNYDIISSDFLLFFMIFLFSS